MRSNSHGDCLRTRMLPILILFATVMVAGWLVPAQAQTFPLAFPTPTTFATGPCCGSTVSLATGDFNGDGKMDVANIDYGSNLNVALGKGDGTFQAPITQNLATSNVFYQAITAGDFNGDGVLDVAIWTTNATTALNEVHMYLGTGAGSFTTGGVFSAPNSSNFNPGPNSIVAADVNADGKVDVVAMSPYTGVFIFLGNGNGTLQPPVANTTVCTGAIGSCGGVAVGDLNGDGKLDLAFESNDTTGGGMSVLLNNGNGTFGTGTYYPVAISGIIAANSIALGDLNGDSKLDAVITGSSVSTIVYLNQGGGIFKVNGTVGIVPASATNNVVLADINGDKKLDLIVPDGSGMCSLTWARARVCSTADRHTRSRLKLSVGTTLSPPSISTKTVSSTCSIPPASTTTPFHWAGATDRSRPTRSTPTAQLS
ncbi:MAG: VCBS repeat-containing protein [Acidobacteriales bacterium]|nr:VCBS repeat-containing protein [Terriglobales bacterium]